MNNRGHVWENSWALLVRFRFGFARITLTHQSVHDLVFVFILGGAQTGEKDSQYASQVKIWYSTATMENDVFDKTATSSFWINSVLFDNNICHLSRLHTVLLYCISHVFQEFYSSPRL